MSVPIGYSVTFDLERPVASSKNRRRIFARGGRVVSLPSADAERAFVEIRKAARAAAGGSVPFGPDDALRIDYRHDIGTDRVRVTVTKVGDLPTKGKRGTKRDVHGMLETIADALQGVLYPNDSAVDAGGFERIRA